MQLQYATIRAPIAGRTGALMVNAGNLVRANDQTPLVTINQVTPIYVSFAFPEATVVGLAALHGPGGAPRRGGSGQRRGSAAPIGRITFVDNAVDQTTGTIKIKGTFPNEDRSLWPGQFVNVVVRLTTESAAIVVPTIAVQTGPDGTYVFLVKDDKTVELRPVTVARAAGTETVIKEGLAAGDIVVTDGHLRLVPGSRVSMRGAERREGGIMNFADLFIKRPITTTLIMLGIGVFGVMSYRLLPVSDLPTVDFPTIQVQCQPARREPRDDGLGGRAAARKAVCDDCRPRLDQLDELAGQHEHHAAVRSEPQHRCGGAGRAGDDRAGGASAAAADAVAAVVPEGQSRRSAGDLPLAAIGDAAAVHGQRIRRDDRAAHLDGQRRRAGAAVWRAPSTRCASTSIRASSRRAASASTKSRPRSRTRTSTCRPGRCTGRTAPSPCSPTGS